MRARGDVHSDLSRFSYEVDMLWPRWVARIGAQRSQRVCVCVCVSEIKLLMPCVT